MKKKTLRNGVLVQKLTSKVLHTYQISLMILLSILIFILSPLLARSSLTAQKDAASTIQTQYKQMITTEQNIMHVMTTDNELSGLLSDFYNTRSKRSCSEIEQRLSDYVSSISSVLFCMIELEGETYFQSFSYKNGQPLSICTGADRYVRLKSVKNSSYFSPIYSEEVFYTPLASTKQYWMFLSQSTTINGLSCIFTVFYNVADYVSNCQAVATGSLDDFIVLNRDGNLIFSTKPLSSDSDSDDLSEKVFFSSKEKFTINGSYVTEKIPENGWMILTRSSWFLIFKGAFLILGVVMLFYLLPLLLFYYRIIPTTRRYLAPLADLTDAVSGYSAGKSLTPDIHTGDEIETLSDALSQMADKINTQIEEIRYQEREKSKTQYSLLATEIDPHFIYNTLAIINSMARKANQNEIIEVNTALSRILRERFSTKASIFETIEDSLTTLEQYHTIMNYRYSNKVSISINADTEITHAKLPKNLLIPIVENSYYHGLCDESGNLNGDIELDIYGCEDEIIIEINDNGSGISEERLKHLRDNHFCSPDNDRSHIGLANVYQRLSYIYKDRFTMNIDSEVGFGTTVSISIPLTQPV